MFAIRGIKAPNLILLATKLTCWTWLVHFLLQATNFAFDCLGFGLQLPHIEVNTLGLRQVITQDCKLTISGPKLTRIVKRYRRPLLFNPVPGTLLLRYFGHLLGSYHLQSGRKQRVNERIHRS